MLTRLYILKSMLAKSDEGATALEYGLLVALIAIVIAVGVAAFGTELLDFFNNISDKTTGYTATP